MVLRERAERVFPLDYPSRLSDTSHVETLSLLDATTANFSATGAIWFLEPPKAGQIFSNISQSIRQALPATLNSYPQWCGRLELVPCPSEANSSMTYRYQHGRLQLAYNNPGSPGVEFVMAHSSDTLESLFPLDQCYTPYKDMHQIPLDQLTPVTELARPTTDGSDVVKPSVALQLTELGCGGMILAVKIAHPLADAHTLAYFVNDLARMSRAIASGSAWPRLSPVFEPARLDHQAAGAIDQLEPNKDIIKIAESLPLHRYDWWAPAEGCPSPVIPPEPFNSRPLRPAGEPMPWRDWDMAAPVSHSVIHLSADQVEHVWNDASLQGRQKVSRHDAVVAHIWSCVCRARGATAGEETDKNTLHCDLVCGFRERLSLGAEFVGSPVIMLNVAADSSTASNVDIGPLALAIRSTLSEIKVEGLMAHLHSVAYEDTPQRLWQAFLGEKHILVTSWANTPLYDVDFGSGVKPRYVEAIMPDLDGMIQIKGSPPHATSKKLDDSPQAHRSGWYKDGVDISVCVRSEVMETLLKDPCLLPRQN